MRKNFTHPSQLSLEEQSELLQEIWTTVNRAYSDRTREELFEQFDRQQYTLIRYTAQNPNALRGLFDDFMFIQVHRHIFEDLSPLFPEGANNEED